MNKDLLKGKIIAAGMSLADFSKRSGIKKNSIYRKLSGKTEFSRSEIEKISDILNLSCNEIMQIFFANKVS